MKLYVLIQEVRVFDRLISANVLGTPDDYDREVTITYPGVVEEEPSAENGWISSPIWTFTAEDLKNALLYMGYSELGVSTFATMGRFMMSPEKGVTLSGEAHIMPNIGHVKVSTRTVEIEV